jgi:predicted amidophosphoribosyltransferase
MADPRQPFTCPACGRHEDGVAFVCSACWARVPAPDRVALGGMLRRKASTTSKVAKIVRDLKARAA